MRLICWLCLASAGCLDAPRWVENCPCAGDELCKSGDSDGGNGCIVIPEPCAVTFAGACEGDLAAIEDACLEAACGEVATSWEAECFVDGDEANHYFLNCEATL